MPWKSPVRLHKLRAAFILSILVYFLIAGEIIIMISPFAAYFFSAYAPALELLAKSRRLAWAADFFLPHLVFTGDWLVRSVSFLQIFFLIGLVLFLLAALPLYYLKIFKKRMAQRGPYAMVRHPQYLALAISGFGLLIYWPRFIILLLYVTMLFVYYALARNEEWRCMRKYGASYEEYLQKTPMFIPGGPGGRIFRAAFGWIRPRWAGMAALYLVVLACSGLAAAALRAHSEKVITKFLYTDKAGNSIMAVPVYPGKAKDILGITGAAVDAAGSRQVSLHGVNLAYVMPADFFLMAVATGEPRFNDSAGHDNQAHTGLADFFSIFFNYMAGLAGSIYSASDVERVIFVQAAGPGGAPVVAEDCLRAGLIRTPRAMADMDLITGKVIAVKKLGGGNKWGRAPMPAF